MSIHQSQNPTSPASPAIEELKQPVEELTVEESRDVTGGMQLRSKRSEAEADQPIEVLSTSLGTGR